MSKLTFQVYGCSSGPLLKMFKKKPKKGLKIDKLEQIEGVQLRNFYFHLVTYNTSQLKMLKK